MAGPGLASAAERADWRGAAGELAWFAWTAAPWLDAPEAMLDRLLAGTHRVMLGLNLRQLHAAAGEADGGPTHRLLAAARERQVRIELLLGEPSWWHPGPRAHLVALLRSVRHLPFDGLNLDLEWTQVPGLPLVTWHAGLPGTFAAARAEVPWPLSLTSNWQEMADAAFLQALAAAGVAELVPMIYVSFPHLVQERAGRLFTALAKSQAPLRVTVAQSFERRLPRGESWHRFGRVGAVARWRQLARGLSAQPAFAGLAIQSLDEFLAG